MNFLTVVILCFSLLGAIDLIIGNKIGIGKEFERAFSLFAPMALSMLGMIVIAPAIGVWITPLFDSFYNLFKIDPSIIPASLFANDMGGMTLAQSVAKSNAIGNYNAFIISSMMGCVISFTIPFSIGLVNKDAHKELFFGLLCGIVTIPIGCFVSGLICRIRVLDLLLNLLPLIVISLIITVALIFVPKICIKGFTVLGFFVKVLALMGLVCSIFTFMTKIEISPYFNKFENAALICANACVTLSGALPFMSLIIKLLSKPLNSLSSKIGINSTSSIAFLGTLVTNASTFGIMEKMDKKGVVLNSAFAVSASFVFGSHLAFTMAFDASYTLPMIIGKIISGIFAVLLATIIYRVPISKEQDR
jgi:ethanolamine transporter